MNWFDVPSPFPEITLWGCSREPWQYVLSHNADRNDWAASAKVDGRPETARIELGWNFATRAEAEAAVEQHYRSTAQ
jgi:hypothetical protein